MMLQAYACPWSLIVPSPLCHGVRADYHQPQILLNPGWTSSRSTWFLGISLRSAATGTGSGQHTPPQCLQRELMVPNTLISTTAAVLKDTFQTQIQSTERCSVVNMLIKFLLSEHEAPQLLFPQCEIEPHTVRQTTLSLRKKWISHFRRQSSRQSLTKIISLFLFWKLCLMLSFGFLQGLKCPGSDSGRKSLGLSLAWAAHIFWYLQLFASLGKEHWNLSINLSQVIRSFE